MKDCTHDLFLDGRCRDCGAGAVLVATEQLRTRLAEGEELLRLARQNCTDRDFLERCERYLDGDRLQ